MALTLLSLLIRGVQACKQMFNLFCITVRFVQNTFFNGKKQEVVDKVYQVKLCLLFSPL